MPTRYIAIAPESGVNPSDLARVSAAIQKQVTRDLAPIWHVSATVDPFPSLEDVPAGYWPIILTFRALGTDSGIHIDSNGQPYALIEMSPSWSLTASHVAMEMITDPFGSRSIPGASPRDGQGDVEFRGGVCDPCEHPDSAYLVNDVLVSDFCTPAFWEPSSKGRRSFTGAVQEPYQLLPGGHLCWYDPATNTWWLRRLADGVLTDIEVGMIDPEHGTVREFLCRHSLHLQATKLSLEAFEARVGITRQRAMRASQSRAYWLRASLQKVRGARPLEFGTQVRAELSPAPATRDSSPRPVQAHEQAQASRSPKPAPAPRVGGDYGGDDRSDGDYDAVTIDSIAAIGGGRPATPRNSDVSGESDSVTTIYELAAEGDGSGVAGADGAVRRPSKPIGSEGFLHAPERVPASERSTRTPSAADALRAAAVVEQVRASSEPVRASVPEPMRAAAVEPVRAAVAEPVRAQLVEPIRATVPGPEPALERPAPPEAALAVPVDAIPQSQPGSINGRRAAPPPLPATLPPLTPPPARASLRTDPPRDDYPRSSGSTIRPSSASIPPRRSGNGWIPLGWGVLLGLLVASVAGVSTYILRRDATAAAAAAGGGPVAEPTPAAPAFAAVSPTSTATSQTLGVPVRTSAPTTPPASNAENAARPWSAPPAAAGVPAPGPTVGPSDPSRAVPKAAAAMPGSNPPFAAAADRVAASRGPTVQPGSATPSRPASAGAQPGTKTGTPDMESIVDEFGGRN